MRILLLIGAGGFIGSICRYLVQQYIQNKLVSTFPYGTLGVNVTGCFLIGLILAFTLKGFVSNDWRLFLVTGICGGYTTFSAFSMESIALFTSGEMLSGFTYIAASVLLGLLATFAGVSFTKLF
jgi:CrcB protein